MNIQQISGMTLMQGGTGQAVGHGTRQETECQKRIRDLTERIEGQCDQLRTQDQLCLDRDRARGQVDVIDRSCFGGRHSACEGSTVSHARLEYDPQRPHDYKKMTLTTSERQDSTGGVTELALGLHTDAEGRQIYTDSIKVVYPGVGTPLHLNKEIIVDQKHGTITYLYTEG